MSGPEPIAPPFLKGVARHGVKGAVVLSAALVLLAGIAVAEWAGWPFLRLPLARQLSHVAAVPVVIAAPFRIRLLGSPRLTNRFYFLEFLRTQSPKNSKKHL